VSECLELMPYVLVMVIVIVIVMVVIVCTGPQQSLYGFGRSRGRGEDCAGQAGGRHQAGLQPAHRGAMSTHSALLIAVVYWMHVVGLCGAQGGGVCKLTFCVLTDMLCYRSKSQLTKTIWPN
jgi:hypothetical protein